LAFFILGMDSTFAESSGAKNLEHKAIQEINKVIHERARMAVMALLASTGTLSFTEMKRHLEMTDGNLSVHIQFLQKAGYVEVAKSFFNNKPLTSCRLTPAGKKAFAEYIDTLEKIVKAAKG